MTATLPLYVLAARITLADGPAPLRTMLLVHVLAGAIALAAGYIALYAAKGSGLHRRSGIWFVYAIVTMGTFAVVINVFEGEDWGGGLLVAYFVLSALETVIYARQGDKPRAGSEYQTALRLGPKLADLNAALKKLG